MYYKNDNNNSDKYNYFINSYSTVVKVNAHDIVLNSLL